jgi:hypothetical protein
MQKMPSIDQYLISTCLFIIDEFNLQFKYVEKELLKRIANEEFTEADLAFRVGMPFRHMAYFENKEKKGDLPRSDIFIKEKDFRIELKFLRNFLSSNKTSTSNSLPWVQLKSDFDWLVNDIKTGKKHKSALILGWFNSFDYFSQIIQLGTGRGQHPLYDQSKVDYFPFLLKNGSKTKDLEISYDVAFQSQQVLSPDVRGHRLDCMLIGKPEDKFNIALYY